MNLHLKTKLCFLLTVMSSSLSPVLAQQKFKYKTDVQKTDSNQFYSITLQPELTAKCQPDLADIRIRDEQGTTVPFLLGNALPVQVQNTFRQLPKVLIGVPKDSLTSYIAENKNGLSIDQLWIKLRNMAVNRTVNLSGSDDLQHWFAIKENIGLQQTVAGNTGTFEELLTFPVSTYRYFKIQVNDHNRTPVYILQVGVYQKRKLQPQYVPIPVAAFASKQRADTSLINITFKNSYRINKLHLQFDGAKYYRRRIQVYSIEGKSKQWLTDSLISSTGNSDIIISAKANKLQLIILNDDNPPLLIKTIQAYQLKQSLVAYLEKQHQYQLYFGNDKASAPRYDLVAFIDSVNRQLPVVSHIAIVPIADAAQNYNHSFVPAWLLWVAGSLALLILLALTLRMTKEVSQEKKKE